MAYRIEDLIMKDKQWEIVFDLLYERQEILNMRSQKDWIEANDPKKQELNLLEKTIDDLILWLN